MEQPKHQFRLKTLLAFAALVCVLSAMVKWELDARGNFAATKAIVGDVVEENRGQIEALLYTASLERLRDLVGSQNLSVSDAELSESLRASMGNINHSINSQTFTETDTLGVDWTVWYDVDQLTLQSVSGNFDVECRRPCSLLSTKTTVLIVDRGGYDVDRDAAEQYKKSKVIEPVVRRDLPEDEAVIKLIKRKLVERGIDVSARKSFD